jgi:hypothetical protein
MLAAWIGVCLLFLVRHYACAGDTTTGPAACRVFVVAVHHYHMYLQLAGTLLMGHVAWQVTRWWVRSRRPGGGGLSRWRIGVAAALAMALFALGTVGLMRRHVDRDLRARADTPGLFDPALYRWIVANAAPDDLFATSRITFWGDPRAFAVIAAGRKLVAAPEPHSHPFVPFAPRERQRLAILAAAQGTGPVAPLCEAASGRTLRVVLPREEATAPGRVEAVTRTEISAVYRVAPGACPTGSGDTGGR